MKSLRLNKELRCKIVENFSKKREASNPRPKLTMTRRKAKSNLAAKLYDILYKEYERIIPDNMACKSYYIRVQLPNESIVTLPHSEDGSDEIYKLSCRGSKVEYVFTDDDPLYKEYKSDVKEYKKQENELSQWESDHKHYVEQVRQIVGAVNTTNQLTEVWPECEQFIPEDIRDPSTIQLPSVSIADLNSQI